MLSGNLLFAQSPDKYGNVYIKRLLVEDGLSQSHVTDIFKDSKGFIWIGTEDGLNRYDGYTFKIYKNNPRDSTTISNNSVQFIYEDKKNRFWIGTNNGGLNCYDRDKDLFVHYRHQPARENSLSQDGTTCVMEDADGFLWIGTYWGLNRFNPETGRFDNFYMNADGSGPVSNYIRTIIQTGNGDIWVGTRNGLTVMRKKADGSYTYTDFQSDYKDRHSLSNNDVNVIYQDLDGDLWIGTSDGLNKFNPSDQTFTHYWHDNNDPTSISFDMILDITQIDKNEIWIGTDGGGVSLFDKEKQTFSRIASANDARLIESSVYNILIDEEFAWIGTYNDGVKLFKVTEPNFAHRPTFGPEMKEGQNSVLDLAEDQSGKIWIGTDGSGLFQYDPNTMEYTAYLNDPDEENSISSNVVKSLLVDEKGNIYVGTYGGGLCFLQVGSGRIIRYEHNEADSNSIRSDHVWSLCRDSHGRIWVGTLDGLDELDPRRGKFIHHLSQADDTTTIGEGAVFRIEEDHRGDVWFATPNYGLNRYERSTGTFNRYRYNTGKQDRINTNEIRDILHCPLTHRLWIATNLGICYYDESSDTFLQIPVKGDLNNLARSILKDEEGQLWIGSLNGIYKLNPRDGTLKNFDMGDGLQGLEFNYDAKLISSSGEFYMGGLNGLNVFRPADIEENRKIPKIVFTGLQLFHKPVLPRDGTGILSGDINEVNGVELEYSQNVITFQYAALDYSFPRKNNYAYRLEGFDKNWNEVGNQTSATYTNLKAGAYVFQVIASNKDGFWNEEGATLRVIIHPPVWQTTWFRVTAGIVLIAIIFLIVRLRTHRISSRNKYLEEKVKERTEKLAAINETLKEEISVRKATEMQLQRAMIAAEAANQSKSQFLANMSHEIRTPINGIIGMTELTLGTKLTRQQNKYLNIVKQSGESLINIINDILDFSRIEAGKLNLDVVDFNLLDLIENVVASMTLQASQKKLELLYEYKNDVPWMVNGDPVRIKQIIVNLVNNAIKFTSKGHIMIKVENKYDPIDAEHVHLHFSVSDTGIGIPKHKLKDIFKTFTQADTSTTRKYGGSGLGLSITRRLVRLMKGDIWAESMETKGSTFHFTLNLQHAQIQGIDPTFMGYPAWRKRKAMIIEDNSIRGNLLKETIENWGLPVRLVTDAEEGLEELGKGLFELVILFHRLGMQSMDFVSALQQQGNATKVILISSMTNLDEEIPGIFAYLNRPVKRFELLKVIANSLGSNIFEEEKIEKQTTEGRFSKKKILLAEDNPINRAVAIQMIKKMGVEMVVAKDGVEAVEAFRQNKDLDLILIDIQMPLMDGFEATEAIRRTIRGKDIPIIALTANAMKGTREECLERGMNDYISKPVMPRDLHAMFEKWFEKDTVL